MEGKAINFTKEKALKFQKVYDKAVKDGKTSFFYQGDEFLTSYAKYLLEYLKMNKVL